jgi:hypothetical protein
MGAMIRIEDNIDDFWRRLSDVGRKQLPFAIAMALNDTAEDVVEAEEKGLEKHLDRPTPYTRRAFYRRRASKSNLRAEVGVKRVQAEYLRYQVDGGVRRPKGRAIVVPVNQRKNQYGNMPKGALKRALAKSDAFVASRGEKATKHLAPGIYQRPKRGRYRSASTRKTSGNKNRGKQKGPKLLAAFESSASYSKRLPFEQTARRKAQPSFNKYLTMRWRQALATAK